MQALLSLPREERQDYKSLMGDAALLVEQLLIHKKVKYLVANEILVSVIMHCYILVVYYV